MNRNRLDSSTATLLHHALTRRAALRWSGGLAAAMAGASGLQRGLAAQDASPAASPTETGDNVLVLGALLSLTGEWSDLGINSEAALELAVEEINEELTLTGSPVRVRMIVEDTRLEADVAHEKAMELADQGVRIFVGPQSSAEVAALKDFVDSSGLLLVSHGSTASSLAIANDNIFRVVPTDVSEVEALIQVLQGDGIEVVVPIWRGDEGNKSLHDSMARLFPEHGGQVLEGVEYAPDAENFAEILATLNEQVAQVISEHDTASVAVYLAAFDEVTALFSAARQASELSRVRWYGTNGAALLDALPADAEAAAFAVETGYPCPLVGLSEETRPRWEPIADQIEAKTGHVADAFALAAYDAAWIATLAYLETGRTSDPAGMDAAFVRTANRYYGVTGLMALDEAGDRATADFDFWAVGEAEGEYAWRQVAQYSASTDQVTLVDSDPEGIATPTN